MSQTTDRPTTQPAQARPARSASGGGQPDLVVVSSPDSGAAEAYRSLRATVKFANLLPPVRSVLVADAGTGGQHSEVAANLAAALALAGDSVVLVDAVLRNPRLHQFFGLPNDDGLAEWLSEASADTAPLPRQTGITGLSLVCAGGARGLTPGMASADLLSGDRCARLLEHLRGMAEFVVIDAAPLSEFADALPLAARVDGVLLLVRSGRTKRVGAQRAKESLDRVGARILGAVLTDTGRRSLFG